MTIKTDDIGVIIENLEAHVSSCMLETINYCIKNVKRVSNELMNGVIPKQTDLGTWFNNPTINSAEYLVELIDYVNVKPDHLCDKIVRIEQMFRYASKYYSIDICSINEKVVKLVTLLMNELLDDIYITATHGMVENKEKELHYKVNCIKKSTRKLAELKDETNSHRWISILLDAAVELAEGFEDNNDIIDDNFEEIDEIE